MTRMAGTLLAAALAFATPAAAAPRSTPDQQLDRLLAGRVRGKPVDCIYLPSVRSSRIIDRRAIVYGSGRRIYVNVPRAGARSLDRDDILVSRPMGSRLCSIDTVSLVDRSSRIPHGFVQLGKFVPYTRR